MSLVTILDLRFVNHSLNSEKVIYDKTQMITMLPAVHVALFQHAIVTPWIYCFTL